MPNKTYPDYMIALAKAITAAREIVRNQEVEDKTSLYFVTPGNCYFPFSAPVILKDLDLIIWGKNCDSENSLLDMLVPLLKYCKTMQEDTSKLPTLSMEAINHIIQQQEAQEKQTPATSNFFTCCLPSFKNENAVSTPSNANTVEFKLEDDSLSCSYPKDKYYLLRCCLFYETEGQLHTALGNHFVDLDDNNPYTNALDFKNIEFWLSADKKQHKLVEGASVESIKHYMDSPAIVDVSKISMEEFSKLDLKAYIDYVLEMFQLIDSHPNTQFLDYYHTSSSNGLGCEQQGADNLTIEDYLTVTYALNKQWDYQDERRLRHMDGETLKKCLYSRLVQKIFEHHLPDMTNRSRIWQEMRGTFTIDHSLLKLSSAEGINALIEEIKKQKNYIPGVNVLEKPNSKLTINYT